MAAEHDHTDVFRDASFTSAEFTGATFRDCDLRRVKITDSWLVDVNVSGFVGNFKVNDVDVAAGYPPADAAAIGIDLDARPSLAEVMEVRTNRMELVRAIVERVTDTDLQRACPRLPAQARDQLRCGCPRTRNNAMPKRCRAPHRSSAYLHLHCGQ